MRLEVREYSYLFQTCGFPAIDDIRAEIESQGEWDFVADSETADQTQLTAARRYGFFEPFTPEQEALANILRMHKAGPLIATYAWGLYADHLATQSDAIAERELA